MHCHCAQPLRSSREQPCAGERDFTGAPPLSFAGFVVTLFVEKSFSDEPAPIGELMHSVQEDYSKGIFADGTAPCISLYQPTHRTFPERKQDTIRFGNLVDSIESSLRREYPDKDIAKLLKPFHELAENSEFWNHALDGLAVLASAGMFKVYRLQRPVPELSVVADSFHTKPLIRIVQSADQFQILALSRNEAALFQGNRDSIDEVPLGADVPSTIEEALGSEFSEAHLTVARYGGGARGRAMISGVGSKKDEVDVDTPRFFRAIDRAILEHHSAPSGLPLMLASLPEYHGKFRDVSHNKQLMDASLDVHPDSISREELRKRAWEVVGPIYLEKLSKHKEAFQNAKSQNKGDDDVSSIIKAAVEGRVATLLIDADIQLPGTIDLDTGYVDFAELDDPHVDDVLDDLAELVIKKGGEVIIVPSQAMPTDSGAAAIYRFATG